MSKLYIKIEKKKLIDGELFKAKIEKHININFSAANYTTKVRDEDHGSISVELIPDNTLFLNELTDIFPLDKYEVHIYQCIFLKRERHKVVIELDIINKESGEEIYLPEAALLTDEDYDHIRYILVTEVPQFKIKSLDESIMDDIEEFTYDTFAHEDILTQDSIEYLSNMVSKRYNELKSEGYADFESEGLESLAQNIVEKALEYAFTFPDELKKFFE